MLQEIAFAENSNIRSGKHDVGDVLLLCSVSPLNPKRYLIALMTTRKIKIKYWNAFEGRILTVIHF